MNVLIVEDDPVTSLFLARVLTDRKYQVTACTTAEEAMVACGKTFFPLLFLDLFLPGMDGFAFCRWLRQQPNGDRQLILVGTASDRAEDLRKILDAGADDYIVKPYRPGVLEVRLIIAQQRILAIEARKKLEESLQLEQDRLKYLATHDPLTKLKNRAAFMETLHHSIEMARAGLPSALVYIDLDNFKLVNDSLGHAAGDLLLAKTAALFEKSIRKNDVAFRLGGDEFGILLPNLELSEAKTISERIRSTVEEFFLSEMVTSLNVGASIGVATIDGFEPIEEVIALADAACYRAKALGRNRVQEFVQSEDSNRDPNLHLSRIQITKRAILEKSFEVFFQPIIDVKTGKRVLYEALVRLPENGRLLSPSAFLPTAERLHLAPEIDRQVITKTLSYLAADSTLRVAINLSGESLGNLSLQGFIENAFATAGVESNRAIFEITETKAIPNMMAARSTIQRLHQQGFRFALDDFGAGFSSFSYLKNFTVDYLKIDGSFIRDALQNPSNWVFVDSINQTAHLLGIMSIAESVEQEAAYAKLREIGVDLAQGYLFGKPGPLAQKSHPAGAG